MNKSDKATLQAGIMKFISMVPGHMKMEKKKLENTSRIKPVTKILKSSMIRELQNSLTIVNGVHYLLLHTFQC